MQNNSESVLGVPATEPDGLLAHERFETVVAQTPVGVQVFAADGTLLQVNHAWEQMWEIGWRDLQARGGYNLRRDQQLAGSDLVGAVERAFAGETVVLPVTRYAPPVPAITSGPAYRWLRSSLYPVKDRAGRVREVVVLHEDLTRRVEAEAARAAGEERMRFLADVGEALASSLDYETTLRTVTRLAVPILADWCSVDLLDTAGGITRLAITAADPAKEQLVRDLRRRYPYDPAGASGVPRVIRTQQPELTAEVTDAGLIATAIDAEHLRRLRELSMSSFLRVPLVARGRALGSLSLVTAESGRHYGPEDLAFAQEVARRCALALDNAQLYAAEQRSRRDAEAASQAKDEFLSILSHELRTPLTPIIGFVDLLRRRVTSADPIIAQGFDVIERSARTQERLVRDLLDVSRIVSGKIDLQPELLSLQQIVRTAVTTLAPGAAEKGVDLTMQLAADLPEGSGDPDRLQQVVWNLVANALKFTPEGGQVTVRLAREDRAAVLTVADTGIGIAPEFLPRVFDRFRQADSSSTRRYGGLGLGLAIVRSLVELHGGSVTAASAGEGQGATFTVRLPLPAERTSSRARSAAALRDQARAGRRLAGVRVLIVEDDQPTRQALTLMLSDEGAEVTATETSAEGFAQVVAAVPDLLLIDIGIPDEDGYSLIGRIRRHEQGSGRRTPAVALTAYAGPADRRRALKAGFDLHLAKPVDPATLADTLARLLQPAS